MKRFYVQIDSIDGSGMAKECPMIHIHRLFPLSIQKILSTYKHTLWLPVDNLCTAYTQPVDNSAIEFTDVGIDFLDDPRGAPLGVL